MAGEILHRLRFPTAFVRDVCTLIEYHDDRFPPQRQEIKRRLSRIGPELFELLIHVKRADARAQAPDPGGDRLRDINRMEALFGEIIANGECYSEAMLAVNGDDLIEAGIKPGKSVGDALDALLEQVIDGKLPNERSALLRFVTGNIEV
jgi:tRNA nucleotidyltransferase (CCA-adding enzyme)